MRQVPRTSTSTAHPALPALEKQCSRSQFQQQSFWSRQGFRRVGSEHSLHSSPLQNLETKMVKKQMYKIVNAFLCPPLSQALKETVTVNYRLLIGSYPVKHFRAQYQELTMQDIPQKFMFTN